MQYQNFVSLNYLKENVNGLPESSLSALPECDGMERRKDGFTVYFSYGNEFRISLKNGFKCLCFHNDLVPASSAFEFAALVIGQSKAVEWATEYFFKSSFFERDEVSIHDPQTDLGFAYLNLTTGRDLLAGLVDDGAQAPKLLLTADELRAFPFFSSIKALNIFTHWNDQELSAASAVKDKYEYSLIPVKLAITSSSEHGVIQSPESLGLGLAEHKDAA